MNEPAPPTPRKRPARTRALLPIASFGPELMALLMKGSTEEVKVEFSEGRKGVVMQQRLHQLRASMRAAGHPSYDIVARAGTQLSGSPGKHPGTIDPTKPATLRVAPRDSEFSSELQKAGVKVEPLSLSPAPLLPSTETATPSEDPADKFLSTLNQPVKKEGT